MNPTARTLLLGVALGLLVPACDPGPGRIYRQTVYQVDTCHFPPRLASSLTSLVAALNGYEVAPSSDHAAALRAAYAQVGGAVERLLRELPPE